MDIEHIDPVRPKPPQAPLDGLHHGLATCPNLGHGRASTVGQAVFAGEYERVASRPDQLAERLLRLPEAIPRCRIYEIAAGIQIAVQDLAAVLGCCAVSGSSEQRSA